MSEPVLRWPLSVPVLGDGTVTLRAHTPADVDPMLEMARDPEMQAWTAVPVPHHREMSEDFALRVVPEGWDAGTARIWALEATDDEGRTRYAGNLDLRGTPLADVGFALHPWARGRGLMVRALRLTVDWSFREGGVEVVHWRSRVGNEASLRVAHAAGFTLHGTTRGLLHEGGTVHDAWTGSLAFGDIPLARTRWAESTVLESDRLRLRPFTPADDPRIVQACTDPETQHWLNGLPRPYTAQVARGYRHDCLWQAATGNKATWAIADRDTDTLLGNIAVMDMLGVNPTTGEVGYWMHPDARGRGVMTEAVRLVAAHALDPRGLDRHRLSLLAADGNAASNAVAVAAGFTRCGTEHQAEILGDGTVDDLHAYELLRA